MRGGRVRRALALAATLAVVAIAPAAGPAQEKKADAKAKAKAGGGKRKAGGVRVPAGLPPADAKARGDAINRAGRAEAYRFHLGTPSGDYLSATYRLSRLGDKAPVVLLVHDKGRQAADFDEPIRELDDKGLAERLQADGFAVLALDLRGHGQNPRPARDLTAKDWQGMTADLQAAYTFLLGRHNRRELNLAKLAVIGLGTGANLAARWAGQPRAAVSSEGRVSDLSALILVSPPADAEGMVLADDLPPVAPRVPVLIVAGEADAPSADAAKAAQKAVERNRFGKVAYVDSALKSERLLRFAPKATEPVLKALDPVKARRDEWEGRYNLDPVAVRDVKPVAGKAQDKAAGAGADPKAAEKKVPEPDPKAAKAEPKAKDKGR